MDAASIAWIQKGLRDTGYVSGYGRGQRLRDLGSAEWIHGPCLHPDLNKPTTKEGCRKSGTFEFQLAI